MKHLLPHFIEEKFRSGQPQGWFHAFTVFADLSGFTALTERLMKQGPIGAEELSVALNHIFQPLVAIVYDHGGFIPYFAGDSFTAIFPSETSGIKNQKAIASKVLHTSAIILERFKGDQNTDDTLKKHQIGIKIGLGYGELHWGITGKNRSAFYFTGSAIEASANAQSLAKSLEVVADASFYAFLDEENAAEVWTKLNQGDFYLATNPAAFAQEALLGMYEEALPAPDADIMARFLPVQLLDSEAKGEFRNVVSVFIAFEGIVEHDILDAFTTVVTENTRNFAGYFKEIDFGDKGGVLVCIFGAPVFFENNIERALEFVHAITDAFKQDEQLSSISWRIGMTAGLAFTGIIGGHERCQYAAVGPHVNLAARLMTSANWGEVVTDENVQRNRNFRFAPKGDLRYKGFEKPITTYRLIGHNLGGTSVFSGAYIGRQDELSALLQFAQPLREGRFGGLAYIFGEAGIGKSRLCFEFRRSLADRMSMSWFNCRSDQILRKPFNPFSFFLKNYFDQSPDNSAEQNTKAFDTNFSELVRDLQENASPEAENRLRELYRTQSVLKAIVGLFEKGTLWEQLDAQGRYRNALDAMSNVFLAEAILQPIVIELEDSHWFDDMSRDFLSGFLRLAARQPVLFVASSRYEDEGSKKYLFSRQQLQEVGGAFLEIDLNYLTPADLKSFAEVRLGGAIHPDLQEILQRMTQGNPFYAEQMTEYFLEMDLLRRENGELTLKNGDIQLSDSVKEIMMARIDRLSGLVKETVKAAAVIGREFELPVLTAVMAQQDEFISRNGDMPAMLREQVQSAERGQIWQAMNELRYIFRHSLLREAAYDMQLRTRLRDLHENIAEAIEKLYPNLEERYADLAFHYEQAQNGAQARKFLEKAAKSAQKNYQNRQAVAYYEKLIGYLEQKKGKNKKLVRMLLRKGEVLELTGSWEAAETAYIQALEKSESFQDDFYIGRSLRRLGHLNMLAGNYPKAEKLLMSAIEFFQKNNNEQSLAKSYGNLGTLKFRQSDYEHAKAWFAKASDINLSLHLVIENAPIVGNLGLIYMNQGNYDEGIQALERQIVLSEKANDKPGLTTLNTNLGIIYLEKGSLDPAQVCLERGLALSEELGNKLFVTICIGSLGTVWKRKGDFEQARRLYQRDLDLTKELGDRQGQGIAFQLMAELLILTGEFDEALDYLERGLEISKTLGYKKGIGKALNSLGDTYFWKENLPKSIEYYNQAVDIALEMGNKFLHAASLLERGVAYLLHGELSKAKDDLESGHELAILLNHPELNHQAHILRARIAITEGDFVAARQVLHSILALAESERELADAHFFLKFTDQTGVHRLRALELYQSLFEKTPEYLYRRRINLLQQTLA